MNISVIGYGQWGKNHARVFAELPDVRLVEVVDQDTVRQKQAHADGFPFWRASAGEDLRGPAAVIIATPPATHFALSKVALVAGKHVLVEKPMCLNSVECMVLTELAKEKGLTLMVGHTFIYNAAVREMRRLMQEEAFGNLYYLHATRTNMGPIRDDVSAHWDLGVHDVAIFGYLTGENPARVSAVGGQTLGRKVYDTVFATMTYPGSSLAHLFVSWLEPQKIRQVVAVGSNQRIVFDDMNLQEPLRIYNRGVMRVWPKPEGFGDFHYASRDGSIVSPKLDMYEPLRAQAEHFLWCIREGGRLETHGVHGYNTIKTLEAMDMSIAEHGRPVTL